MRDATTEERAGELALGPLLAQLLSAFALLTGVGLAVVWWFRPLLDTAGGWFVDHLGPWGVALAFGIPDATGIPLPPDTFVMLALSGGISYAACVLFGTAGSIVGGTVGYVGSRMARRVPWIQVRLARRAAEMEALVARYGPWALAAGALTPLPYSLMAWACGLLGMPLRTFLLISLLRAPRVGLYALPLVWALNAGS